MDNLSTYTGQGSTDANSRSSSSPSHPTLSRESTTSTITPTTKTESWPSTKQVSQQSQSSAASPAVSSPHPSREPSPTRPVRSNTPRATGTRSRKNSQQDPSPPRLSKSGIPNLANTSKTLSGSTIPRLQAPTDSSSNVLMPQKSPATLESLRLGDAPRWPVSPRLRSPPPILNKPILPPPRRVDSEMPVISVQRSTPSSSSTTSTPLEVQGDSDADDSHLQPGMRTPRASSSQSTLETVQEVSPLPSPRQDNEDAFENLEDSMISELSSQADATDAQSASSYKPRTRQFVVESSSEAGSSSMADRRSASTTAHPTLTSRQSSTATLKALAAKGKAGEGTQTMTVETETVTSIPQVPLGQGTGVQGSNISLRTKPSSDTIRPKREKKRLARKQPAVTSGTGEQPIFKPQFRQHQHQQRLRHHQSHQSVASAASDLRLVSPSKWGGPCDEVMSPCGRRDSGSNARSQSYVLGPMSSLLTRHRIASSKADIFEAKVASAVEEANSSDSEETFVYDSNPPDGRERPHRFHSRTPSATSMMSQVDRVGMRSIPGVLDSAVPAGGYKKGMKFVSVNTFNNNPSDGNLGDEDGKGTGRSHLGSTRGTRPHHHVGSRWGRPHGGGNGHASLFADESPFIAASARSGPTSHASRQSSRPPSPRFNIGHGAGNSRRGIPMSGAYDLDDTHTGADDERTPLMQGSIRSTRSARSRRLPVPFRALEQQSYRQPPSFLNRFASCLVLTVMLLLVISGAIGFMFATSQPLTDIELIGMTNVLASEQELMLDITVKAHNPNVVVVAIDSADIEVFAKSPHAGTDSEWWQRPHDAADFSQRRKSPVHAQDDPVSDPPRDDTAPNMRLGTVRQFDSPLSFEGSFFHRGISASTGEIRLQKPGNGTVGGSERWERIMQDEFDLILKGVLKYSLPLSQRIRSVAISGRTTIRPNSANDPTLKPNSTHFDIHF